VIARAVGVGVVVRERVAEAARRDREVPEQVAEEERAVTESRG
jgi:hypothetical protein